MQTDYPEHVNGDTTEYIWEFRSLEERCNEEVRKYAQQPTEIDLPGEDVFIEYQED